MSRFCFLASVMIAATHVSTCRAQLLEAKAGDWPWWRGPSMNGIAEAGAPAPVEWSETKNVAWKTPIPGRGHSSPTVVGKRVLLTTADEQAQVQSVLCFERRTGRRLWSREINRGGFPERIHAKNTHATSSVACDGERAFATFLNHDRIQVVALDLDGEPLWDRIAGGFTPDEYKNGYAASPLLYGSSVIVAGDFDGDAFLLALDRKTGERVWSTPRPSKINYASPVVAPIAGRDQLLISGGDLVASYDPRNGKPLWKVAATTMATAGSMVWDQDLVFASGGFPDAETVSIRADGSGKVVWRNDQKCYEQSMLAYDGHVYAVNDAGIAYCWNAETGKEQWRERLRGPISASPVLSGGNIYVSNERGVTFVYRATPARFESVARNQIGSEAFATSTICGGQIFLRVADRVDGRREEMLVCLEVE